MSKDSRKDSDKDRHTPILECVSAWNKGSDSLLMQFGGCLAL